MDVQRVEAILRGLERGKVTVSEALERLRTLPFDDLGFAKVDTHRALRRGAPEVVYSPGKTPQQVVEILRSLAANSSVVLATKAEPKLYEFVKDRLDGRSVVYHDQARIIQVGQRRGKRVGKVVVVTAGTSDIPIAEEAATTAEAFGSRVDRLYDVGVAGIHRLLEKRSTLDGAKAVVVVAGMEGALPSVVAGLTGAPVIAVPTSVGYGASFQGLAALLAMMNSCSPGTVVVNIDNGFGAGYFAHILNRPQKAPRTKKK